MESLESESAGDNGTVGRGFPGQRTQESRQRVALRGLGVRGPEKKAKWRRVNRVIEKDNKEARH